MGLDMYLSKRTYVKNWNFMTNEEKHQVSVKKNGKIHPFINPDKVTYIAEECAYWRKANAIHAWFVSNVQDGVDDCKEYWVTKGQLQELYDACVLVRDNSKMVETKIENGYSLNEDGSKNINFIDGKKIEDPSVAEYLLPSQSGFFFGSTDYDQFYMEDIENTIKMLEPELKTEYGSDEPEYYYRASW